MLEERLLAQEKEHRGAEGDESRNDAIGEEFEPSQGGKQEEDNEEPSGNSFGHVHFRFSLCRMSR